MTMNFIKRIVGEKDDFSVESAKMPFFRLVFSPFNYIIDNGKSFFLSASVYSIILTVLSYALGTLFLCGFEAASKNLFCATSPFGPYTYIFIKGILLVLFSVLFYGVLSHKAFKLKKLFEIGSADLKLFGLFVGILVLCMLPVLSMYLLYVRVPNPDWVIELLFFGIVSLGFLVPFVVFRFLSIIGLVLEERHVPSFIAIWSRNAGNMFKIICDFDRVHVCV